MFARSIGNSAAMWWWGRATARCCGRRSATTASTCAGPITASHPTLAAQGASLSCQPLLIFSAAAAFFLLIIFWYNCAAGRVSRGTTENLCRVHGFSRRRNSAMVRNETLFTTAAASSSSAMGGAISSGIPVSGTGETSATSVRAGCSTAGIRTPLVAEVTSRERHWSMKLECISLLSSSNSTLAGLGKNKRFYNQLPVVKWIEKYVPAGRIIRTPDLERRLWVVKKNVALGTPARLMCPYGWGKEGGRR